MQGEASLQVWRTHLFCAYTSQVAAALHVLATFCLMSATGHEHSDFQTSSSHGFGIGVTTSHILTHVCSHLDNQG